MAILGKKVKPPEKESVFVIYKDGKRLTKDETGINVKIAYLKKGSANGVVTGLVNDFVHYELDLWKYNGDKYTEAIEKERARYQVKEFIPLEEKKK